MRKLVNPNNTNNLRVHRGVWTSRGQAVDKQWTSSGQEIDGVALLLKRSEHFCGIVRYYGPDT